MSTSVMFARQPILSGEGVIVAYEFFFRDSEGLSEITDDRSATATVISNLLNQTGLQISAGDSLLFVNVDDTVINSDIINTVPPSRFVLELASDIQVTQKLREMILNLRKKGYQFALDNVTCTDSYMTSFELLLPLVDYVKIDTTATDFEQLEKYLPLLKTKKLIAHKVEIPEVYEAYKALGFDYFQGYFFSKLHLIRHNRLDPKHLGVIRIYNMLLNEESMDDIAVELEKHNELSLQLLQYINSSGIFDIVNPQSMREIISKIGPERMIQWLSLIIFSKSSRQISAEKSPHSLLVQQRIDLMFAIIKAMKTMEEKQLLELARLTAFLSLMESVFNVPMSLLLEQIKTDDRVENALLSRSGKLGRIFALALAIENDDYSAAQVLLRSLKLPKEMLQTLQSLKTLA